VRSRFKADFADVPTFLSAFAMSFASRTVIPKRLATCAAVDFGFVFAAVSLPRAPALALAAALIGAGEYLPALRLALAAFERFAISASFILGLFLSDFLIASIVSRGGVGPSFLAISILLRLLSFCFVQRTLLPS